MNLGEGIYKMIAGHSPAIEDNPHRMAQEALRMAGSINKLAAALGTSRSATQGWFKGGTPSEGAQELLRAALRRAWLSTGREGQLRRAGAVVVEGDQDQRRREIVLDAKYLHGGTVDRAVDAYLRGARPSDLQRVVWKGIHNAPFYKTLFHPGGPGHAPKPPAAPAQPSAGGPAGGGGPSGKVRAAAPAGGGWGYEEDTSDLAYEGMDLDDDYSMSVSGVHT